ncbi:MAG: RbcX chaperonin protein [Oscillatoria sp. SIO1A7]|nr:RbcX chaperonin protein [Oscillatoria sp. SIO1A7]
MDPKRVAKDTAVAVQNYLTYQAVRIAINQLTETNPGLAIWLRQFSAGNNFQQSEMYLEGLLKENKELGLRIMTIRQHLAEEIMEFMPEMVQTNIRQANMEHRRELLERMTQSPPIISSNPAESTHPELDANEHSD